MIIELRGLLLLVEVDVFFDNSEGLLTFCYELDISLSV